jgi:hypothetical protein
MQETIINKRVFENCLIQGDGAKITEINGEIIYLVSRSATNRLRHGERCSLVVTTFGNGEKSADLLY